MSEPIKLKITRAGLGACFDARVNGIDLKLKTMKFSSEGFESVSNDERTSLPNVVYESMVASGGIEMGSNTLRIFSVIDAPVELIVRSLAIYTEDGVLFAIASVPQGHLFRFFPQVSFVLSLGMTLSTGFLENIQIVTDENSALAMALISQHESSANPHPQYQNQLNDHQDQIDDIVLYVDGIHNRVGALETLTNGLVDQLNQLQTQVGVFPRIIMAGVFGHNSGDGWYDIMRPQGKTYDFTDPKYAIVTSHEARSLDARIVRRHVDKFSLYINVSDYYSGGDNTRRINYVVIQIAP